MEQEMITSNGQAMPVDQGQQKQSSSPWRIPVLSLLILLVLLFIAFLTCPKKADHVNKVTDTFKIYLTENKAYVDELGLLGSSFMSSILSYAVQTQLEVKDRWIFSVGEFGENAISVGVFGHVWVLLSQEDFDETLEKNLLNSSDD
jgi:hypothetical protein